MVSQYFSMFSNLILVTILIIIMYIAAKKFTLNKYSTGKFINILQVLPVGQKEKIVLLESNNTLLLVGVTANHIETLHVIDNTAASEVAFSPTLSEVNKAGHG